MLIQSTLILLALSQGSAAETPVENPPVETPKKAELKLFPEQGACNSPYRTEFEESGALQIGFDKLNTNATLGNYRAVCRLGGELIIPRGYKLNPSANVSALVKGLAGTGVDNYTGRLKFEVGRYVARDFQTSADGGSHPGRLELKAAVPEVPLNCEKDVTWPAYLFIESTTNGGSKSCIEYLKLDALTLVAGECPGPTEEPTPVPDTLPKP